MTEVHNAAAITLPTCRPRPQLKENIQRFVDSDERNSVSIVHPDTHGYRTPAEQKLMREFSQIGRGQYISASGSFLGSILLSIK